MTVTIDNTANVFNGMAALAVRAGVVVGLYVRGALTNNGDGGTLRSLRSTDRGGSFTTALVTNPGSGHGVNAEGTRVCVRANGDLLLFTGGPDTNAALLAGTAAIYPWKSTDGGVTWTQGTALSLAGLSTLIAFSQIIERANGDLWACVYGAQTGDPKTSAMVLRCPNGSDPLTGSSWAYLGGSQAAATAMRDAGQNNSYTETDLWEYQNGHVLLVSRVETDHRLWYAISTNAGVSWSAPALVVSATGQTAGSGVSPCLAPLTDGTALLTFGQRFDVPDDVMASRVTMSGDTPAFGVFQTAYQTAGGSTDAAYQSVVQTGPASLLLAVYDAPNGANAIPATLLAVDVSALVFTPGRTAYFFETSDCGYR